MEHNTQQQTETEAERWNRKIAEAEQRQQTKDSNKQISEVEAQSNMARSTLAALIAMKQTERK